MEGSHTTMNEANEQVLFDRMLEAFAHLENEIKSLQKAYVDKEKASQ